MFPIWLLLAKLCTEDLIGKKTKKVHANDLLEISRAAKETPAITPSELLTQGSYCGGLCPVLVIAKDRASFPVFMILPAA